MPRDLPPSLVTTRSSANAPSGWAGGRDLPRLESDDGLGLAVLQKREVLPAEAPHRPAVLVEDHDVGGDGVGLGGKGRDGRPFLAERSRRHEGQGDVPQEGHGWKCSIPPPAQ